MDQYFGNAVSLSGDRALIGERFDDDSGKDSGSAYLFGRQAGGAWTQLAKIKASDGAAGDLFGWAVSLAGNRILIGARQDDDVGEDAGSAYVFDLSPLSAEVSQISVSAGGTQDFGIDAGHLHAGETYLLLGSFRGTKPGIALPGGLTIPLNPDEYFRFTLENPNTPPLFDSMGTLNGAGHGFASFKIDPGTDPTLIGHTVHHAFVTMTGATLNTVNFASNAVPVLLVP